MARITTENLEEVLSLIDDTEKNYTARMLLRALILHSQVEYDYSESKWFLPSSKSR